MKPSHLLTVGLATLVTATSTILFKNYCLESLYLTINSGAPTTLPSGQAFTSNIVDQGNTALVTKTNDPFNGATAKMVLGTSTDQGLLYWSLSSQNGDPFVNERFNVTSGGKDATGTVIPNICQNTTSYDSLVHSCQDSGAVVLTVFACPFNAAA